MPEGPEVKNMVNYLDIFFKNSIIKKIQILKGRYKKHVPPCGYHLFNNNLPLKVLSVNSKGKFIYFILENDTFIFNTLGMSGFWSTSKYKHSNIKITTNKKTIYFTDQRNFGTFKFVFTRKELNLKLRKLGPDMLDLNTDYNLFLDKMKLKKNQKKIIAKVLLDQSVISGIGNYLRSEILWASRISPFRSVKDLNNKEMKRLYKYTKKIIWSFYNVKRALKLNIVTEKEAKKYPSKSFLIYMQDEDPKGRKIVHEKIGDRMIHWVPKYQK